MEISRSELYERVWTTPLRKLAAEFGVSDVGLAKACRRHHVPTPPAGHWMRVEHGKEFERPALPAAPNGEVVDFDEGRSKAQRPAAVASLGAPLAALGVTEVAAAVAPKVEVAADVSNLAPFAKATLAALKKSKPNPAGLVLTTGAALFNCAVNPALVERAALILDAIERKIPKFGGTLVRGTDYKNPLALVFGTDRVVFTLAERYTRTEFIPESERKSPYPRKDYRYHLMGELKLTIQGYFDGRKSWSDGARGKLEIKLPEILAGLAGAAAAMRQLREEREEQSRKWEEQARIRAELEAQARRRSVFREAFAMEAASWHRHHAASEYLAHVRQLAQASGAELPEVSQEWLAHAQQAVVDLDPSGRRLELLQAGCKPDWASHFGVKIVDEGRSSPYL